MQATLVGSSPDLELEDPIREIASKIGRWCWKLFLPLVGMTILCILFACVAWNGGPPLILMVVGFPTIAGWYVLSMLFGFWIWWRAFAPRRATDVFYLRSFRNDADTWPIRVEIQKALGRRRRLSGIRDPQRRAATVLEHYSPFFLAMKYCTPRYMDLEAGNDWKARLWYSLRTGELAILDLSVLTPFVKEEMQLAAAALGRDRLVFLGRTPQTVEEVRQLAASELGISSAAGPLHVLIWPGGPEHPASPQEVRIFREQFAQTVQSISRSPRPPADLRPDLCGDVVSIPRGRRKADSMFRRMVTMQVLLIGFQIGAGVLIGLTVADESTRRLLLLGVSAPFALVNLWLLLQNWLVYIYDVGIWGDRLRASVALIFTVAASLFGFVNILDVPLPGGSAPQAAIPPPLTAKQLANDELLLKLEDQAESQSHAVPRSTDESP